MKRNQPFLATMSAVLVLLASPAIGQAASLDKAIGDIVLKLNQYLESKNEKSISIGQFVGPPQLASTSGPSISQIFQGHFEKQGIEVRRRSNVGLRGEYQLTGANDKKFGVRLACSLVDVSGQVLTDFSLDAELVDDQGDVVDLLGATASLFPDDLPEDRDKDLKKSIVEPKIFVDNTKCKANQRSPYGLEIYVGESGLPIHDEEGLGFVSIRKGDTYKVRLHNDSDLEAAARLSIDGLNVFTFSEVRDKKSGKPKYNHYIIPPHRFIELKGWHKNNEVVHSFLVTSYAESAAATIDHKNDIGTITVQFSAAWPKDSAPPEDESFVGRGDKATGFGPPTAQHAREVQREIGKLRAAVSLRYDK